MRVPAFLTDHHVPFATLVHPPAYTAARRAHMLHLPGRQLAKSVLLNGPRGNVLAILPATHQLNLPMTSKHLEGPVRLARREEIADVFCDCEWGVASPFGSLYGLPSLLDNSFQPDAELVFEAHFHAMTIRLLCRDFEKLENPRRATIAVMRPDAGELL